MCFFAVRSRRSLQCADSAGEPITTAWSAGCWRLLEFVADFSGVFTDLWNRSRFGHGDGVVTADGVGRKVELVSVA